MCFEMILLTQITHIRPISLSVQENKHFFQDNFRIKKSNSTKIKYVGNLCIETNIYHFGRVRSITSFLKQSHVNMIQINLLYISKFTYSKNILMQSN